MIVLWTKTPGLHKTQSSFILETKAMDHWPNKWKIFISIIFWSPQSSNASLRLHLLLQCNLIISKKKKWILSRASRNEVNKKINEQVHHEMGPRRKKAVRNPSECHFVCLCFSFSAHPVRCQLIAGLTPINPLGDCRWSWTFHLPIKSPPPPPVYNHPPVLFFSTYFLSVWVSSTKDNFLFKLQQAFSLTRGHCDNAVWELRGSLMRSKSKCTGQH